MGRCPGLPRVSSETWWQAGGGGQGWHIEHVMSSEEVRYMGETVGTTGMRKRGGEGTVTALGAKVPQLRLAQGGRVFPCTSCPQYLVRHASTRELIM